MSVDSNKLTATVSSSPQANIPTILPKPQKSAPSASDIYGDTPASPPPPPKTKAQETLADFNNQQASGGRKRTKVPTGGNYDTSVEIDEGQDPHLVPSDSKGQVASALSGMQVGSGLAVAFFTLIALLWLLVPTQSGYTRAQLLWFTLFGNTKLTTDTVQKVQGAGPTEQQVEQSTAEPQTTGVAVSSNPTQMLAGIDFSAMDAFNGI